MEKSHTNVNIALGVFTTLLTCLDIKELIQGKNHTNVNNALRVFANLMTCLDIKEFIQGKNHTNVNNALRVFANLASCLGNCRRKRIQRMISKIVNQTAS